MKNVLLVLKRDILRLLKVPPALVVVLFLIVLPSIYTWYNVAGFWDPYGNTGALRVCVVNEDAGGSSEITGHLDVGDQVVDGLKENDQLDWQFVGRDQAMEELASGKSYAVFVIPEDFTEKLLTITTGDFQRPDILYYVNEKTGPVAPKITDTGASTLDRTINAEFVGTVSHIAAQTIDAASDESHEKLVSVKSKALSELDEALGALGSLDRAADSVKGATVTAKEKIAAINNDLSEAYGKLDQASADLKSASQQASDAATALTAFSAQGQASLSKITTNLSQMSTLTSTAVSSGLASISEAKGDADAALAMARPLLAENAALIEELERIYQTLPDSNPAKPQLRTAIDSLQGMNESATATVESLEALSAQLGESIESLKQANTDFATASQELIGIVNSTGTKAFTETLPQLAGAVTKISGSARDLSEVVAQQKTLVKQSQDLAGQVVSTLDTANEALAKTQEVGAAASSDLSQVRTDIAALSTSGFLAKIIGTEDLNADEVAAFMASPTSLKTEQLYPLTSYGVAMAPLFMNLTFWIGAFMLLIILKQEVDGRGIRKLTLTQRYLGRFCLLAILVVLQSAVCCTGLLAMGVQPVNMPALYVAAAACSLAYLSIIYCLSVTMQHVGKGICIILVFAQIPGATGLYPIEMTSPFFQAIYPFFPFTYGIGALREAICGFYGSDYVTCLGVLALFFIIFMALGILLRPLLANVNRMFARQIEQGDIYNGENVHIPARRYRMRQVLSVLSDQEGFRDDIVRRYERFDKWYPRLIRGAVVVGIVVPLTFTIVFSLNMTEKVVLLTAWLIWFGVVAGFLIIVENLRYSMRRQMRLDSLAPEKLQHLYEEMSAGRQGREDTNADADYLLDPNDVIALPGAHKARKHHRSQKGSGGFGGGER
ncbi:YhgE/Pip domain-containing protein [Anaerotardibacter muris]|uniref:YhgE/Pip domain-containing protein n=1 Tax=Anaerotardibacter muris TaxID=2941505 RepID=UPI00203F7C70|nr:YhgE/Pip domain-containing protein [Anaerotardibacter muris]